MPSSLPSTIALKPVNGCPVSWIWILPASSGSAWSNRTKIFQYSIGVSSKCVFACLANELKSGDVYVPNSQDYADTRERLLPWSECEKLLVEYCERLGF